jgi:hypothetical protein
MEIMAGNRIRSLFLTLTKIFRLKFLEQSQRELAGSLLYRTNTFVLIMKWTARENLRKCQMTSKIDANLRKINSGCMPLKVIYKMKPNGQ